MKHSALLLTVLATATMLEAQPPAQPQAQAPQVRTVYFLPMQHGLDQYLANRLTNSGVVRVTADAKKADAIFTDALDGTLEKKLDELFPPPAEAVKAAEPAQAKEEPEQEPQAPREPPAPLRPGAAEKDPQLTQPSAFHHSKGTLFLVDVHSRNVVWSTYAPPKDTSSAEMDRTAARVVARFEREIKAQ